MTEEYETIHLVKTGRPGEKISVWCGRFIGVCHDGDRHFDRRTNTPFLAVHPHNRVQGPTCGACLRIVGMLKTANLTNETDKRQRYKGRRK